MACSFGDILGSACGDTRRMPKEGKRVVPLLSCSNDISTHLKNLKIPRNINSEATLILSRIGDFSDDPKNLTICPRHRASLGNGWKKRSERCQVPYEISGHFSGKGRQPPKGDRGMGYFQAKKIFQKTSVVVHMGSGKIFSIIFVI